MAHRVVLGLAFVSALVPACATPPAVQGPAFCHHFFRLNQMAGKPLREGIAVMNSLIGELDRDSMGYRAKGDEARADAVARLSMHLRTVRATLSARDDAGALFLTPDPSIAPGVDERPPADRDMVLRALRAIPEVQSAEYRPVLYRVTVRILITWPQAQELFGSIRGTDVVMPDLFGAQLGESVGETASASSLPHSGGFEALQGDCRFNTSLQLPFVMLFS